MLLTIPNFGKLLIEREGSGILNWALLGLRMVLEDIDKNGGIYIDETQKNRIDTLLAQSDSTRLFLNENIELNPSESLTVGELEEAYANYCKKKGWDPKNIIAISRELSGLMLQIFGKTQSHSIRRDNGTQRGFRGVSFKKENF